jgi:autotransporter-associated beta strand protein
MNLKTSKQNWFRLFLISILMTSAPAVFGANWAWSTAPATANFSGANWTSGTVPGTAAGTPLSTDSLFFGTSSKVVLNNDDSGFTFGGITFNSGASAFTISGNAFTLGGSVVNSSTSAQIINNNITLAANEIINTASGNLTLGGAISDGGNSYSLTKNGGNTLTLGGANTFSGALNLNGGTLAITALSGLGNGNSITNGGASTTTISITQPIASGTVTLPASTTVTVLSGATALFKENTAAVTNQISAKITGAGGSGTASGANFASTVQFDNDANDYTGNFGAGAGTVQFTSVANGGSPSALGAGTTAYTIGNGNSSATFRYIGAANSSTTRGINWNTTGTGTLAVDASGAGTVQYLATTAIRSAASSGANTLTLQGTNTGANTLAQVISDPASGATSLSKSGAGTWVLTGANTYSGVTTINQGILSVSSINYISSGSLSPNTSSSLGHPTTVASGTIQMGGASSTAALTYTGTGETSDRVINLAGATTGGVIDQSGSGTLKFTSNFTATNSGAKTLTLKGSTSGVGEIDGAIVDSASGATSLAKSGSGTWTLAGANTFSGNVTVSAGQLWITSSSGLGSGTKIITIQNGNDPELHLNGAGGNISLPSTLSFITANPSGSGAIVNEAGDNTIDGVIGLVNGNTLVTINGGTLTLAGNIAISNQPSRELILGGAGNGIVNGVIANGTFTNGNGLSIVKIGAGTWTLNNANTYSDVTIINAGTLALGSSGTIGNTPSISIGAGASFDVSAVSSYTLSGSTTLRASGTGLSGGNAATINGGLGGTVSLGAQPISLTFTPTAFTGDAGHPSLYISQGTLALNGNSFTVNNASGTPLGAGIYSLIQQANGNIASSGSYSVSVTGSGTVPGAITGISVNGGSVNLLVTVTETPIFSNLSASQSILYGQASVILSGQISATGPVYPAIGETINVTINGNAQTTTINDATGDFSLVYNSSTIPASAGAYTISYAYGGNASLTSAADSSTALSVTPAPLTVTASDQSKSYGQSLSFGSGSTSFTSSGLRNGETIGSVTLSVSGNGGAASATAGSYSITPSAATGGTFSANNYSVTYQNGTLTVSPAVLTVSASGTLVYGATNPVYTVEYANFVNGETLATSDVSGSPVLTTEADTNSPVGEYVITNSLGTLTSTNYSFNLVNGILTVTNALSANLVSASANPALPGVDVSFAASLSAMAPSLAVPDGAVQFVVDGNLFGAPVTLTNGQAAIDSTTLSHGYHTVEADYFGNTNIVGSTNTLRELINTPPIAGTAIYSRQANLSLTIPIASLLTNATDADGDALALVSVSANSTNGASVTTDATSVLYVPMDPNANVADSFDYTVVDSFGAASTGTVQVVLLSNSVPVTISGPLMLGNGSLQLNFIGTPGFTYLIEATADLKPPVTWAILGTNAADTLTGSFSFTDQSATNYSSRFYRTSIP